MKLYSTTPLQSERASVARRAWIPISVLILVCGVVVGVWWLRRDDAVKPVPASQRSELQNTPAPNKTQDLPSAIVIDGRSFPVVPGPMLKGKVAGTPLDADDRKRLTSAQIEAL